MIQLGFVSPTENGQYIISLEQFENIKTGMTLYLEDLYFDSMNELSLGTGYKFASSSTDHPTRFRLHFMMESNEKNVLKSSPSTIYSYEKTVYVQIDEAVHTGISVFNLMGQKVAEYSTAEPGIFKFDLNIEAGYYVVRAQSGTSVSSEKVFIQ
jgi:hypothetical protein